MIFETQTRGRLRHGPGVPRARIKGGAAAAKTREQAAWAAVREAMAGPSATAKTKASKIPFNANVQMYTQYLFKKGVRKR